MRSDKIQKSHWGVEEHPPVELLRQYEEGVLSSALSHELERHLMDCELCEDVLGGMALTDRNHTEQAKHRILQRIRIRLRKKKKLQVLHGLVDWRVAVAVLMMFCSLGLLLFFHYTRTMTDDTTSTPSAGLPGEVLPPSPEELLARTIDSALVLEIQAPPPAASHNLPSSTTQPKAEADRYSPLQQVQVTGRVLSPTGAGIQGVRILMKGTVLGTYTDQAGNFALEVPASLRTLVLSRPGYETKEADLGKLNSEVVIRMQESDVKR
ncbi:carboxypeptidase-like regulatory domain-containing protein [Pontibacter roseus]|uniref:carboxypeptidase-like regulatory domain-containing protein n=1 Tax=Pontibacter roseus TaxID=336989 RepID=UPI0003714BB0|nr:carboxypeptidase-like regulatory domain-containing protein [Pontibacter roseus]